MILVPPAAPITERTCPLDTTIVGVIDERGRFFGLMKLAGLGGRPKKFTILGEEKSSISSLRIMPVSSDTNAAPKLKER